MVANGSSVEICTQDTTGVVECNLMPLEGIGSVNPPKLPTGRVRKEKAEEETIEDQVSCSSSVATERRRSSR